MPKTKKAGFVDQTVDLAGFMKALGHPARIEILKLLLERETCICGTLVDALPLSQATVSQHLAVLKKAGIIKGTIKGQSVCYCLDEGKWLKEGELATIFLQTPLACNVCE